MSTVRLTPTSYVVLGLLERLGPATPYDLKCAAQLGVSNFWSLPHAQLYVEPARLATAGLLNERQEQGGRRRLCARGAQDDIVWRLPARASIRREGTTRQCERSGRARLVRCGLYYLQETPYRARILNSSAARKLSTM